MSSIAGRLGRELDERVRSLSASERYALALRLGDEAVQLYAAANHVPADEARRVLRRNNRLGRRPCRCMDADS